MKKTIYLLGTLALCGLNSCDSGEEEGAKKIDAITICDCIKGEEEMRALVNGANGDEEKITEIKEQFEDLREKCIEMNESNMKEYKKADTDIKKELKRKWEDEAEAYS